MRLDWKNPIYRVWAGIKKRCLDKNYVNYKHYGGRGIEICDEWKNSSVTFINWAINNGYQKGLQIDRIDNDGNYSPENCRFVTVKINNRNTRRTKIISYLGETKSLAEWCELLELNYYFIYNRLWLGWDFQDAISKPKLYRPKFKICRKHLT